MDEQSTKHNKSMPFITIWSQPAGKPTKNYTKLCKTKPILKSCQCPQTLLQKILTKDFAAFCNQKTKPIQSQFTKRQKMNITSVKTKDYENERPRKAKKTNPIKAKKLVQLAVLCSSCSRSVAAVVADIVYIGANEFTEILLHHAQQKPRFWG